MRPASEVNDLPPERGGIHQAWRDPPRVSGTPLGACGPSGCPLHGRWIPPRSGGKTFTSLAGLKYYHNPPTNRNNQHPVCPPPPNRGWCDGGGQTQATEPEHLWGGYHGWTAFVITVIMVEYTVINYPDIRCSPSTIEKSNIANTIYHPGIITHENVLKLLSAEWISCFILRRVLPCVHGTLSKIS